MPSKRKAASRLLFGTFLIAASINCAGLKHQHWLDATYPRGASRSVAAISSSPQNNELIRTIWLKSGSETTGTAQTRLPEGALDALGQKRAPLVVGFDEYDVRLRVGSRKEHRVVSRCDFVFFDDSQTIVGAYRRLGSCDR
ncbi:MAG: hypothetical protein QF890_16270 [Myxococcota bacterium]|jgi:hypothetical protein|nr:hypothetical protein [bacterium]MDP7434115.1 hypothetical protein [Myxococcota bacterium]HJO24731.1 hypothetical protein [Myxococcota bacterium]